MDARVQPTTAVLVDACLWRCRDDIDKNTRSALIIEFKDGAPFSCYVTTQRGSIVGGAGDFDADYLRLWEHHSVGLSIPVVTVCAQPAASSFIRLGISGLPWADAPRVCGRCGSVDHEKRACVN